MTQRTSKKREAKREIDNARRDRQMSEAMIKASAKAEETLAKCFLCPDGKNFRKDLVIAQGDLSYLSAIPERGLHRFHCQIVPKAHLTSLCDAEAALLKEIDLWKGCLIAMLRACHSKNDPDGFEAVFVETALQLNRNRHCILECIPIPLRSDVFFACSLLTSLLRRFAGDISIHLTKAIREAGEEWGSNKKLVPTWGKRVHNCVPKVLPWCCMSLSSCF